MEGRVELGALQRRVSEVKNEHVLVEPGMRCAACEMMLGTERVALTKERKVVHARCVSKEELIELTDLFCRVCSYFLRQQLKPNGCRMEVGWHCDPLCLSCDR